MNHKGSQFMHWAKTRPKAKYDLALSGILNLPFAELDPQLSDLELHGDNAYGYRPLVDTLAVHCRVGRENVVTVSGGTSMAKHLAMAARVLVDEVYLEAMFENAPKSALSLGREFVAASSLTQGYGLSGLRCGWILAEAELAEKIRRLDDIFAASAPNVMERLSVSALNQLPKIAARAKAMLETNRRTLNNFFAARDDIEVVPTKFGT